MSQEKEQRDLNLLTSAFFDVFSLCKTRPSTHDLKIWLKQYHNREQRKKREFFKKQ